MVISNSDLENDLRLSPNVVVAMLITFIIIFTFMLELQPTLYDQHQVERFTILFYVTAIVTWIFNQWFLEAGRWMTVIGLFLGINAGISWLGGPEFLALMTIPTIMAAMSISLSGAGIVALAQTVLLLVLPGYAGFEVSLAMAVFVLMAIWGALALMVIYQQPRFKLTEWLWQHYQRTQDLLDEARNQKVELKRALDDLAKANQQLTLLNERLKALHLIAEEAQKAKATFVAKVSHELRTPLNMIIGLVDVLTETPDVYEQSLPPSLLEDLEIVQRNCEHLASLINDVLDLSQTEAGRLVLHREDVDLTVEIESALTVVYPLLDKKDLDLQVIVPPDLPLVYCDRTRIRQVILNLLSNAARYTNKGQIILQAKQEAQNVIIKVIDTGPGIAVEDAERIFEPFYQSNRNNVWRDQGGSGLGLSISKQFIENHDGHIWLESELGMGSTFAFSLPVSPLPPPMEGEQRWVNENWLWYERTTWPQVPDVPHKQRIIIYDETKALQPLLKPYEDDIDFVIVEDLNQATRALDGYPAHAIMVNTAPAHRLWPLVEWTKQRISDTPIVGCALPLQVDHALQAGAVNYLTKPITRTDLYAALECIDDPIERVLVVDDNPDVQQLLTRMLHAFDGSFEVQSCASGEEALADMVQQAPDLVLLDIVLSGLDGWQVLKQKQQDEAIKDIPVIIISAQDPTTQQVNSDLFLATIGPGLPINRLIRYALEFSDLTLSADQAHRLKPG